MKREDEAIANIIRMRREQGRLRKAGNLELLNYKSRIIDLIETFVSKQPTHNVTAFLVVSLAEVAETQLVLMKERHNE